MRDNGAADADGMSDLIEIAAPDHAAMPARRLGQDDRLQASVTSPIRLIWGIVCAIALTLAFAAHAQPPDGATIIDEALQSGNGQSSSTAYTVPGLLWEYEVLGRLHLRFVTQRTAGDFGADVITARDPKTGRTREMWFRAAVPAKPEFAAIDRAYRAIMTSGDGASPETAFIVGGRIDAEYKILRFMGIRADGQALLAVRGCAFDRQSGRDIDTGEPRMVYFKLGHPGFDYSGECVLQSPS